MDIIPQYLPDLFTPVVNAMAMELGTTIYYRWGHKEETAGALAGLDKGVTTKTQKYPLVWLVMDFEETKGDNVQVYAKTGFSFVFCVNSKPDYTEQERRDKSFLPLLLPMYASFMNNIGKNSSFRRPDPSLIKHSMILRPYWGTNQQKNMFNDWLDAIEIRNLKLDVSALICIPS